MTHDRKQLYHCHANAGRCLPSIRVTMKYLLAVMSQVPWTRSHSEGINGPFCMHLRSQYRPVPYPRNNPDTSSHPRRRVHRPTRPPCRFLSGGELGAPRQAHCVAQAARRIWTSLDGAASMMPRLVRQAAARAPSTGQTTHLFSVGSIIKASAGIGPLCLKLGPRRFSGPRLSSWRSSPRAVRPS